MIYPPRRIESARLVMRPYRRSDLPALPGLIGNWEVARWLSRSPYPYTDQDARDWLHLSRRIYWLRRGMPYAVIRKEDAGLIGGIGIGFKNGEIGYWLGQAYWGQGFATEAVNRMADFALGRWRLHMLWAAVLPENTGSQQVLRKAGFQYVGSKTYPMRDGDTDSLYFELSRNDWIIQHG